MRLNHLNLPVQDVGRALAFFETFFGFKCIEIKGDALVAILHGTDGFLLVLMSAAMAKDGSSAYPDAFHIGFMLDDADAIEALYQQLLAGGIVVGRAPAKIRGSFGFYFYFETILIEVGTAGERNQ